MLFHIFFRDDSGHKITNYLHIIQTSIICFVWYGINLCLPFLPYYNFKRRNFQNSLHAYIKLLETCFYKGFALNASLHKAYIKPTLCLHSFILNEGCWRKNEVKVTNKRAIY